MYAISIFNKPIFYSNIKLDFIYLFTYFNMNK